MERSLVLFGIVAVIVGFEIGYLMYAHPEGLNPAWPLGLAMLAPAAFILSGMHMIAAGLGYPGVANMMLLAVAVCLVAIVNWAAFFTTRIQCSETVSFLGVPVLSRYPSEAECRVGLRIIISCMDALILLPLLWFAWRKWQSRSVAPTK
jgi:hypothetical protein